MRQWAKEWCPAVPHGGPGAGRESAFVQHTVGVHMLRRGPMSEAPTVDRTTG